ncbi:MAG TPA: MG2 domain-containing protein [Flavobacteriaceae bacterium]|nr:MG2 domain-containing protein [Flavobacteriaceae bacterium]
MIQKYTLFIFLIYSLNFFGQDFEKEWATVIEYEETGSVKSALKKVDAIYEKAKETDNNLQVIKTLFFQSKYLQVLEENAQTLILKNIRKEIEQVEEPHKTMLEFIYISSLNSYLNKHYYRIKRRTPTAETETKDFKSWTLPDFEKVMDSTITKTIDQKESLKDVSLKQFELILDFEKLEQLENENFYDFLLRNYIEILSSQINRRDDVDPLFRDIKSAIFGNSSAFISLKLDSLPNNSLKKTALLYQEREKEHPNKESVVFDRMNFFERFVYKDSPAYLAKLNRFQQSIKDTAVIQKVQLKRADLYIQLASKEEYPNYNKKANALLDSILKTKSRSNTYKNAYIKKERLKAKTINLRLEEYVYEGENNRAYLRFGNTDSLYLKVFKVPSKWSLKRSFSPDDSLVNMIIKNDKPEKTVAYELPNKNDFFTYSTEILMPSLKKGTYLIAFAADESEFDQPKHKNFTFITVTDLSVLRKDGDNKDYFQVVHRKTGKPIQKASIHIDEKKRKTNKKGVAKVKRSKRKNKEESNWTALKVTRKKDTLNLNFYKHFYYSRDDDEQFDGVVKFFLDRAIYRPGQKVYVKGIAIQDKKRKKAVTPELSLFLEVKDANNEVIKELEVQTNEFGSFTFDFIVPKNGITGNYSIAAYEPDHYENDPLYSKRKDEHLFWDYADFHDSKTRFKVEEYKRPTFKIDFKPLTESKFVNETVSVSGKAISYSGVNLDNAKVTYRVERKSYPHYWRIFYPEETKTITEGETTTTNDGSFKIDFEAIPYSKFDKEGLPVFEYTVYADITDSRGETQSSEITTKVGYHNLKLSATLPELVNMQKENNLKLNSTNLNGEFTPAKGKISVFYLSPINQKFKERIFPQPEIPGFTREEFNELFPYEENLEEESETLVFTKEINTESEKEIALDFLESESAGNYKIVFSAKDSAGNLIEDSAEFTLIHSEEEQIDKIFTITQLNTNPFADGFVEVEIHSPIKKLFIDVIDNSDESFTIKQITLQNGNAKTKIPLNKNQTSELTFHFNSYFENQFFKETHSVEKPQAGAIDIAVKSFRNKIEPGSEQTWSFAINQDDKALNAEVLASMYDSSLDQFTTRNWKILRVRGSYYGHSYYPYVSNISNKTKATFLRGINPDLPKFYFTKQNIDLFWFGFDFAYPRKIGASGQKRDISKIPENATTVFGIITDENDLAIPGVNVQVKGTSRSTNSDFDGYYSIEVAPGEELNFSAIGFSDKSIYVITNEYNISMEGGEVLEEVMISGYRSSREEETQSPFLKLVRKKGVLQGRVSGVMISENTETPDSGTKLRIRGNSSITDGKTPLIIIDGEPQNLSEDSEDSIDQKDIFNLSGLNPDNIATVSVLKSEEAISLYGTEGKNGAIVITTKSALEELIQVETRKNFDETAFFKPQLRTDKKGNISFNFTSPEALTQWKLRLFAHDKKAQSGYLEKFVITQKELMISPNMPRFLREKDSIWLTARISNLTSEDKSGMAMLQLFDAITMEPVDEEMGNQINHQNFKTSANGNTTVTWKIKIPEGVQAVQYKVIAKSGNFSDGEENLLPVLTNSILVTESIPIWVRENTKKEYSFEKLENNTSSTLKNHQLTLEYTSNPTWLAIQALPYLMEYEHDCSEQVFSRYYANAIAAEILHSNPKIAAYFKENQTQDLKSELEQNEELKSIILSETPWLKDLQSEEEKQARLALLFDLEKLAETQESTFDKLKNQQKSNGSFPWFEGGEENEFITRHIVAGFGKLSQQTDLLPSDYKQLTDKAINYLDSKFQQRNQQNENQKSNTQQLKIADKHYLYARSFYLESNPPSDSLQEDIDKKVELLTANWLKNSLYQKAISALVLHRFGDTTTAKKILHNLKETSSNNEDWGMYWIENKPSWFWYNAPIETQALLIEAFAEIDQDRELVEAMKVWLLKNKQVNHWSSTKSTFEAINAMLRYGKDWTPVKGQTEFKLGNSELLEQKLDESEKQAATGYFKIDFDAMEISKDMADLSIDNKSEVPGFGGFYWQYFEEADKIESNSNKPLSIKKELYLKKNTSDGQQLQRISANNKLNLGDLITVRLIVSSKENMEFIHLKDMRASAFEPIDVLSKYNYNEGLGYYKSTRDAATHFFFDKIPKGTYVLEYDVRANNIGSFSNGISTLQSMYAPEFGDYSEGIRVEVAE